MLYRKLGDSQLEISVVGLGTWAIGGDFFGHTDDGESVQAIHSALDNGINFIDTAPAYGSGHSEEVVGRALREVGTRNRPLIGTKVGIIRTADDFLNDLTPESIQKEIDDSLRRLGVDVIDLYQIHWPDPNTPVEESLAALSKIYESGKFRYLGVSNFSVELIEQCQKIFPVVSAQPQYSLLERSAETELIPYCNKNSIGTLGYGTFEGGLLTGKYRDKPVFGEGDTRADFYSFFQEPKWTQVQKLLKVLAEIAEARGVSIVEVSRNWAIRENGGVTAALVGVKTEQQARMNTKGTEWKLSDQELAKIEAAYRNVSASVSE